MFFIVLSNLDSKFAFLEVWGGPGGFRTVRKDERKKTMRFSSKKHWSLPSYDQKTKKLTTKKMNEY